MALPLPRLLLAAGVAAAAIALAWLALSSDSHTPAQAKETMVVERPAPPGEQKLVIGKTQGIAIDGDFDDPGWKNGARTGAFVDDFGATARPYTDGRVAWGDGMLFVGFYSADENIVTHEDRPDGPLWLGDDVHLALAIGDNEYTIDVSPSGTVTDGVRKNGGPVDYAWQSGAHVGREMDGTINDPTNDDEEWLIELAIPLTSLGLEGKSGETMGLRMRRCDTPKKSQKVCASAVANRVELR